MSRPQRSGLTLLELMVVLIILAIVATVAMRSLEPQINSQRIQSASRLLDEIRAATMGQEEKFQLDGTPLTSGFVADTGCLPLATIGSDGIAGTTSSSVDIPFVLSELWDIECNLALNYPFQFRSGPDRPVDYSTVRLPCGWRGPYLRLAAGSTGVMDPWGQALLVTPTADGQVGAVRIDIPASAEFAKPESMSVELTTAKVDVTGTILLDDADQTAVVAVLLTPNPQTSLTRLVPIADEASERSTVLFRKVPIGFRAIVVDVGNQRQVKYIQVSHRGANVVFDFRQQNIN